MRFLRSTAGPVEFVIEVDDTEDVAELCAQLARQCHVDEEEQANLQVSEQVQRNQVQGDAEPMPSSPTKPHPAPEGAQIVPSIDLVGDQQGTPFGPEKLELRGDTQGRKVLLGAQESGLQIRELQCAVLEANLCQFLDDALLGFRGMASL